MIADTKKIWLKAGDLVFSKKGFTLIELMIALTVLTIALLGTASVIINVARNRDMARKTSAATNLCQAKIEELKSLGYPAVDNCLEHDIDEQGNPGGIFDRTVVVNSGPVPNTKLVLVRVTWEDFFRTRSVFLPTVIANI